MKKQIFNYVSTLNVKNGRYSNCAQMVRESVASEIQKGILDKNSLAWAIFSEPNRNYFTDKQIWVIVFELLKNEAFVEMIRVESMDEKEVFFAERETESSEATKTHSVSSKHAKAAKKLGVSFKVALAKADKSGAGFIAFLESINAQPTMDNLNLYINA